MSSFNCEATPRLPRSVVALLFVDARNGTDINSACMVIRRCEADPSALANYVVALVKKDKPEKDLKALCADQLDVFLQKGGVNIPFDHPFMR